MQGGNCASRALMSGETARTSKGMRKNRRACIIVVGKTKRVKVERRTGDPLNICNCPVCGVHLEIALVSLAHLTCSAAHQLLCSSSSSSLQQVKPEG